MNYYIETCINFINKIINLIFRLPFQQFYLKGPSILGCWENRNEADICSSLTGSPADFWRFNKEECLKLINNKFESYYILFIIILYLLFLFRFFQIFWWRYFIYKPITNDLVRLLDNYNLAKLK